MDLHVGHLGGRLGYSCWTLGREAGMVHVGHLGRWEGGWG